MNTCDSVIPIKAEPVEIGNSINVEPTVKVESIEEPETNSSMTKSDGYARLRPEFLIRKEAFLAPQNPDVSAKPTVTPKRQRGINRGREQAMTKANQEVRAQVTRLCKSLVQEGAHCRFGDRCNALHSVAEFWERRPPDIASDCPLFDAYGRCQFGVSCRFAGAHTVPQTWEQRVSKSVGEMPKPLNAQNSELLMRMRKHQYDYGPADRAVADLPTLTTGAMSRERLKLDPKSLGGKRYLAPLTTVGNLPFRRLCVELGVEITCGEMAVATSLLQGFQTEWSLVKRHPSEKIFGVQLAGGFPDSLTRATQMVANECKVDFIDLNLGCPIDLINDKCGGCALANRPTRCVEVLKCMNAVARDVPVTMKVRYGMTMGSRTAHHLMRRVLDAGAAQLITLHPRSREQRYSKLAEWDYVPTCAEAVGGRCPLWVCGDVINYEDYYRRLDTPGVDGVMIGRGALIKPWLFTEIEERRHWDISVTERLDLMKKFVHYGLENWGSDCSGVETTRRFMLEWLSFQCRYIPVGILEQPPQRINERPPIYRGRNEMESLLASPDSSDWVKITEIFLGPAPDGFLFVPKHRANAY